MTDRGPTGDPRPARTPPSRGAPEAADAGTPVVACDLCGAPMIDRHCKLSCSRCGYQRDCSDP